MGVVIGFPLGSLVLGRVDLGCMVDKLGVLGEVEIGDEGLGIGKVGLDMKMDVADSLGVGYSLAVADILAVVGSLAVADILTDVADNLAVVAADILVVLDYILDAADILVILDNLSSVVVVVVVEIGYIYFVAVFD